MRYPALDNYIARLHDSPQPEMRVWKDAEGRAQGRYFHSTLTSAFQSVRHLDTKDITGYEGFIRSYSPSDEGLSIWKFLDLAANDDESIELDRLCRMLHAINFFRQSQADDKDLYLSVHTRLLAAVDGNHGMAFGRILRMLGLPQQKVVLQLPAIVEKQGWLLNYVADNYRRNGFRIAINAIDAQDGVDLLCRVRADVVKVDGRDISQEETLRRLVDLCAREQVRIVFKRVEDGRVVEMLHRLQERAGYPIHAQGYYWDSPRAVLAGEPEQPQSAASGSPPSPLAVAW